MLTEPVYYRPTSIMLTPFCTESLGIEIGAQGTAVPGNLAWSVASTAYFWPIAIPEPVTIVKAFWYNGTTVDTSTNVQVGVYDEGGTLKVASASGTKQSASTSVIQEVDITDTLLPGPARYYLAMVADTTAANFFQSLIWPQVSQASGMLQQASAYPLPSTATFAQTTAGAQAWVCGVSLRTLVA